MQYTISRFFIITTLILLAACGGGGSDGGGDSTVTPADPSTGGAEIQITINEAVSLDGSTSSIQYTIKNLGDTDTGSFEVVGWYHRADAPDYLSTSSGTVGVHANLAAGATETAYITISNIDVTIGAPLVAYVIADFGEVVAEADEGLTGTNDNLSQMAWTVNELFSVNDIIFVDNGSDPIITAFYNFESGSVGTHDTLTIDLSRPSENIKIRFVLSGEPVIGNYILGEGVFLYLSVEYNGVIFDRLAADNSSYVNIGRAGAVEDGIGGHYAIDVCPVAEINFSGDGTCKVATTNYKGSFHIVRDSDSG